MEYRATHTQKKTSETFGVSETTIKKWKKLQAETGSLDKRPLERSFKKIDPEKLRAYVAEYPDDFLEEIAERFACSGEAIRLALKKHGITRKKNAKIQRTQ